MKREEVVFVSYSQICVFDSTLEAPFNPWSDEDSAKYFVESDRSVSFRTEHESGNYVVELTDVDHGGGRDDLIRRIEPLAAISSDGLIEVASISDGFRVEQQVFGRVKVLFEEFQGFRIRITLLMERC